MKNNPMRKRFAAVLVLLSLVCVASVAMAALVAPHPFGAVTDAPVTPPAPTIAAPAPTPAPAAAKAKKPLPARAAARLAQAKAVCKAQSTPGHACRPAPERKGQPRNAAGIGCVCE